MNEHRPDMIELSAHLDGELDPARQRGVATHLAACPACAAQLDALRMLAADFARLPGETLGFDLAAIDAERAAIARLQDEQQKLVIRQLLRERELLSAKQRARLVRLLLEQPVGPTTMERLHRD